MEQRNLRFIDKYKRPKNKGLNDFQADEAQVQRQMTCKYK